MKYQHPQFTLKWFIKHTCTDTHTDAQSNYGKSRTGLNLDDHCTSVCLLSIFQEQPGDQGGWNRKIKGERERGGDVFGWNLLFPHYEMEAIGGFWEEEWPYLT